MNNWWLAGLGIGGFGAVACSAGPTMGAPGSAGAAGSDGTAAEGVCRELAAQVAGDTQTTGTCTVAVRLDYASLKIMGHAYYCGDVAPMTEDAATAIALQDNMDSVPVTLISGHAPADEWVFSGAIGDFGRATAISVRSGLTVFQGGLDWGGPFGGEGGPRGGVLSLGSTESSSDLGSGCGSTTALPLASYDLRDGADSAARPEAALSAVLATALPAGLLQWGTLLDAVVLTYAGREQAPSEAWKANYVVLLNAGAAR